MTCDAPRLLAALRLAPVGARRVVVTSRATLPEVVAAALEQRPDVVTLPADAAPSAVERELARDLRRQLPAVKLLLALPPDRCGVEEDLTLYDGLVSLDEPAPDLAPALARPPSERRAPRVAVPLPAVVIPPAEAPFDAMAVDVSDGGAGLLLPPDRAAPAVATVRFHRDDGRGVALRARQVWATALPGGTSRMGVRFVRGALNDLHALRDLAFWRLVAGPEGSVIHLCGELGEAPAFAGLAGAVLQTPRLDLSGVTCAGAAGLLRWYDFVRAVPADVGLRLRRVPQRVAGWIAAVPQLERRCVIESTYVASICSQCGGDAEALVDPRLADDDAACPACGGALHPAKRDGARARARSAPQ